jgi:hypothetical protein
LAIYHLVLRQYVPPDRSVRVPWGWVLLIGLGLVQLLQGAEHYVVGLAVYPSLDDFHKALRLAHDQRALDSVAPAWVAATGWWVTWRAIRWLVAMSVLACLIVRQRREDWSFLAWMTAAAFTSLFVAIAEMNWMVWPGLRYDWAVVLRPWRVTLFAWDRNFAVTYLVYGLAGLLWGWVLAWVRGRRLRELGHRRAAS